jgi:hypothetical protein
MKVIRVLRVKAPGKSLLIRSSLMSHASPLCVCPNHGLHLGPDWLIVSAVVPLSEQRGATNACESAMDAQLTCNFVPQNAQSLLQGVYC